MQDAAALTELIDVLQSCQSIEEAYVIAGRTLRTLLHGTGGTLYMTSPSRDLLEPVASWGDDLPASKPFAPESCWGLRRGKLHIVDSPDSPVQCKHVDEWSGAAYVCFPLTAHGEAMGMLFVKHPLDTPTTPGAQSLEAVGHHITVVGERISLVFANLALRDVLRRQSMRDPLTRLFNRRYLEESLERECRRAIRHDQQLAVVMLDVDHFKEFNDTVGHQVGDSILRALADLLTRRMCAENVACRYGGEEFALLLPNASISETSAFANILREELKRTTVKHAGEVVGPRTVSIGIAGFPEHGTAAEDLSGQRIRRCIVPSVKDAIGRWLHDVLCVTVPCPAVRPGRSPLASPVHTSSRPTQPRRLQL